MFRAPYIGTCVRLVFRMRWPCLEVFRDVVIPCRSWTVWATLLCALPPRYRPQDGPLLRASTSPMAQPATSWSCAGSGRHPSQAAQTTSLPPPHCVPSASEQDSPQSVSRSPKQLPCTESSWPGSTCACGQPASALPPSHSLHLRTGLAPSIEPSVMRQTSPRGRCWDWESPGVPVVPGDQSGHDSPSRDCRPCES